MRESFTCDGLFFEDDGDVLYCAVTGGDENVLVFQRIAEAEDGSAIHLEYNDQSNGGYGCIESCTLTRNSLSVDLSSQLGELDDVEGFDVTLEVDDETYEELENGLKQIFQCDEKLFKIK